MPSRSHTNRLRIISYHYSNFGRVRTETHDSHDRGNGDSYLRSTSSLYAERNTGLRPLMPQSHSALEEEDIESMPLNAPVCPFVITATFRMLMNRFEREFNLVFPDIPCAYCGYLSSTRTTSWLTIEEAIRETTAFELVTQLHLKVHQDARGRVAVCNTCRKKPRRVLDAGPWPSLLLDIPKRSRPYLSPLKLNCSLGRTQSHSATTNYHNPWSTYRTLTGIALFYGASLKSSGNMYLTCNDRALCLYAGITGAFLTSQDATAFDLSNHPWEQLNVARLWLLQHNRLFAPLLDLTDHINGTCLLQ